MFAPKSQIIQRGGASPRVVVYEGNTESTSNTTQLVDYDPTIRVRWSSDKLEYFDPSRKSWVSSPPLTGPSGKVPGMRWAGRSSLQIQNAAGEWLEPVDLRGPAGIPAIPAQVQVDKDAKSVRFGSTPDPLVPSETEWSPWMSFQGPIGPIPKYEIRVLSDGTTSQIRFQNRVPALRHDQDIYGEWVTISGPRGPRGPAGPAGPKGECGAIPRHRWDGPYLQFENPDGSWGDAIHVLDGFVKSETNGFDLFPPTSNESAHTGSGTAPQRLRKMHEKHVNSELVHIVSNLKVEKQNELELRKLFEDFGSGNGKVISTPAKIVELASKKHITEEKNPSAVPFHRDQMVMSDRIRDLESVLYWWFEETQQIYLSSSESIDPLLDAFGYISIQFPKPERQGLALLRFAIELIDGNQRVLKNWSEFKKSSTHENMFELSVMQDMLFAEPDAKQIRVSLLPNRESFIEKEIPMLLK